ncbi:endoplasmic reticulum tubular network organization protein [Malassezia pachydermatis]
MVSSLLPWWPKTWNPFNRWQWSNGYDYETYLSSLADEIESVESTILDIKARKRRTIHNVLQVMLTLWIISLVILWAFSSFIWGREWAASRSMFVVLLLLGTPLFIAVLHRLVTIWFRRLERAQESHLATLRKQQRSKINEIKKATDFEHLRSLLERYDTDSSAGSSFASGVTPTKSLLSRRSTTSLRKKTSKEPSRLSKEAETSASSAEEQAKKAEVLKMLAPPITSTPVQNVPSTTSGSSATRPTAMGVHPRGWMDKVADMILGTDPYGVTLEDQQYALICRNCFRHNGLVPKSELDEIRMYPRLLTPQSTYAPIVMRLTRADHQVDLYHRLSRELLTT